jgi:hypothetical protein
MAEFYINLFEQEDYAGTNRPHFKARFKLDDIEYECPFWPNKDGKKGLSGKAKPKVPYVKPQETVATGAIIEEAQKQFPGAEVLPNDEIPFG